MKSLRSRFAVIPRCLPPWRIVVSLGLLVAYLVLSGEAIHCQYFAVEHSAHGEHDSAPARATDHATHCILANHGTSIAIDSASSVEYAVLRTVTLVVPRNHPAYASDPASSAPARAPPAV